MKTVFHTKPPTVPKNILTTSTPLAPQDAVLRYTIIGVPIAFGILIILVHLAKRRIAQLRRDGPYRPFHKLEEAASQGDIESQHQLVSLLEYSARERVEALQKELQDSLDQLSGQKSTFQTLQATARTLESERILRDQVDQRGRALYGDSWDKSTTDEPSMSDILHGHGSLSNRAQPRTNSRARLARLAGSWRISNTVHPLNESQVVESNNVVPSLDFSKLK